MHSLKLLLNKTLQSKKVKYHGTDRWWALFKPFCCALNSWTIHTNASYACVKLLANLHAVILCETRIFLTFSTILIKAKFKIIITVYTNFIKSKFVKLLKFNYVCAFLIPSSLTNQKQKQNFCAPPSFVLQLRVQQNKKSCSIIHHHPKLFPPPYPPDTRRLKPKNWRAYCELNFCFGGEYDRHKTFAMLYGSYALGSMRETKNWRAYCELHFCFWGWVQPSQDFGKAVWKLRIWDVVAGEKNWRAYCEWNFLGVGTTVTRLLQCCMEATHLVSEGEKPGVPIVSGSFVWGGYNRHKTFAMLYGSYAFW